MRAYCVFSETWFCDNISDDSVAIGGFDSTFRSDRNYDVTDKKRGGGVCIYINETWCPGSNVTARKHLNTSDVDLLSLSLRPLPPPPSSPAPPPLPSPRVQAGVCHCCVHSTLGLPSTGHTAGGGHCARIATAVSGHLQRRRRKLQQHRPPFLFNIF